MTTYNSVLYTSGENGPQGIQSHLSDIQASGVTTVVLWALHIGQDHAQHQVLGDLIYNDYPYTLVSNGVYQVSPDGLANPYPQRVAQLKDDGSSVAKIYFSVGGGGPVVDFTTIASIIADQGTGEDSILYKNFKALRDAFTIDGTCVIDGIDLDNEDNYSQEPMVKFCEMLFGLGFAVSFCPYTMCTEFWQPVMNTLWQKGFEVSKWNLQMYALLAAQSRRDEAVAGCARINLWNYAAILASAATGACNGEGNLVKYVEAINAGLGATSNV